MAAYMVDPKIDSYSEIPLCSNTIVMGLSQGTAHEFSTPSIGMSQSPSNCVEPMDDRCEMAFIPEFGDPLGRQNIQCGGSSLSLVSKTPLSAGNQSAMEMEPFPNSFSLATFGKTNSNVDDHLDGSVLASTGLDSKYVKAAQQLLDEVVNVRAALNELISNKNKSFLYSSDDNIGRSNGRSIDVSCDELLPVERQALKNKSAKLLAIVEEVDERYREYYQQMQILRLNIWSGGCRNSGDEEKVGRGKIVHQVAKEDFLAYALLTGSSDKTGLYSNLVLPDSLGDLKEGFLRALSLSFAPGCLNTYPKDSDKLMLAKQTGLPRHQVANWFINARVRLWKPMVEEMYKEEFGDPKTELTFSLENTSRTLSDRPIIMLIGGSIDNFV